MEDKNFTTTTSGNHGFAVGETIKIDFGKPSLLDKYFDFLFGVVAWLLVPHLFLLFLVAILSVWPAHRIIIDFCAYCIYSGLAQHHWSQKANLFKSGDYVIQSVDKNSFTFEA